ncbi:hypothetical protein [Thermogemmata fonticola]|uniref:Uncharacterized protein n=1 Tax=Thermogemmata fonticola TaxID=2755323 RepID=A0A7V8VC66_9BACT|nr:hypothetical protein [Thermogemmata fonticola]MBA2225057.1 hypothetical protein [Thermogemmata fonticola]
MKTPDASHSAGAKLPLYRVRQPLVWLLLLAGALGVAGGCQRLPPPGGSNSPKAEKARRQAEQLAENAVYGAAIAYARSHPQTESGGRLERWWRHIRQNLGLSKQEAPPLPRELLPAPVEPPLILQPATREASPRPKSLPRPGPPVVIRERVVSEIPRRSVVEAEEDALTVAAEMLAERFAGLDPPLHYYPTWEEIRQEYMRRESWEVVPYRLHLRQKDARYEEKQSSLEQIYNSTEIEHLVDVEFDIEVTSEQIRYLRSRKRLETTVPILLLAMLILLGISVWLRLDEWSHGYFSRWLAMALTALVSGALGFWYFS